MVGTACGGAAGANQTTPATSAAEQQSADLAQRTVGQRLAWLVHHPEATAVAGSARACVVLGATCGTDGMLDVDTTRLRAASLADDLGHATDPSHPEYLGQATPVARRLAQATVSAAARVGALLHTWLADGCGSSIDGIPTATHPPTCEALGRDAAQAIDGLTSISARWT